jgi:methylenetetrahydrofolate dehydrogenase (NADP+)/methenyltetrahydrofolate cyclohydrolase
MILLDGKKTSADIRAELRQSLDQLPGRKPGLAVVLVGEDPASQIYVKFKVRACEEVGLVSEKHTPPANVSQAELETLVARLNAAEHIDGILVQLPLPDHIDAERILQLIDPAKDVDGFHPVNMGRLALGLPGLRPCTPQGVIEMLRRYDLSPAGKRAVVLGRSNITGKPLSILLGLPGPMGNATVTLCHSRTPDLPSVTREADFLFAAIGRDRFVTADMVKQGAVVIDIGMNRTEDGLHGDCDFEGMKDKVAAISPVPGGVGPMTITQLLANTIQAHRERV